MATGYDTANINKRAMVTLDIIEQQTLVCFDIFFGTMHGFVPLISVDWLPSSLHLAKPVTSTMFKSRSRVVGCDVLGCVGIWLVRSSDNPQQFPDRCGDV